MVFEFFSTEVLELLVAGTDDEVKEKSGKKRKRKRKLENLRPGKEF
jgi:hypothetical protein